MANLDDDKPGWIGIVHRVHKRLELEPHVIAERMGDFLVMTDSIHRLGYVIDHDQHLSFPITTIDTILARGYWEPYEGTLSVEQAEKGTRPA